MWKRILHVHLNMSKYNWWQIIDLMEEYNQKDRTSLYDDFLMKWLCKRIMHQFGWEPAPHYVEQPILCEETV